jgi:hypothetical protein
VSYLHCPTCQHAYNLAREPACPRCHATAHAAAAPTPVRALAPPPLSPTAEIVACAVALARALRRATPAERDAARASLGLVRAALAPPPRMLRRPTLLAAAVVSLLARVTL